MTTKIQLLPGETMAEYYARVRLEAEATAVASVIRRHPGIASKDEIAAQTGFDPDRVAVVLQAMNRNETKQTRVDYGLAKAKAGSNAGEWCWGWYPMNVAAYQRCMDYADWHSSRVERGIRESRLARRMHAKGLTTKQAKAVMAEIEDRMAVPVDQLTAREAKTFERLADKQAAQIIKMNGSL